MSRARLTTALFGWLVTAACTIVIGGGGGGDQPVPGIGIGDICSTNPAVTAMPEAHVIFDVHIDRSVAGIDSHYARWMRKAYLGLFAAGVRPSRSVLLRLDERPVPRFPLGAWGCDLGGAELDPERVIEFYAADESIDPTPLGCALDPIIRAGSDLGGLVTSYPAELPGTSNRRVFGARPDVVLVVHIDSLGRTSGYEDPACEQAARLAQVDADGRATWLEYSDGRMPFGRVFHWFIATAEGVDRPTFVERCRRVEGFPTDVLDLLEPSARALYDPVSRAIEDQASGLGQMIGMCAMLSPAEELRFLEGRIRAIASAVDATVNEELFEEVISGDGVIDPERIPEQFGPPTFDGGI